MQNIVWILIFAFVVYQCSSDDDLFGPPETLPLSRYDDVYVNVYFYFPSGEEVYLGRTKGATSCGDIARSHAYSKHLQNNRDWGYICCTEEDGSSCYRKIR